MIVSTKPYDLDEIRKIRIAVPGTLTTAYLALKLFAPEIETAVVPFDQIIPQVLAGNFQAGLIIHEGQLTWSRSGLSKVLDLGEWWREQTKLPLPLGGNAIRRSLGEPAMQDGDAGAAGQHPARARPSRRGAGLRHAVRARRAIACSTSTYCWFPRRGSRSRLRGRPA